MEEDGKWASCFLHKHCPEVLDRARGFEASWAGSPFHQAFLCMFFFPSMRMKRLWEALSRWELFLKVHFGARILDCSSRAKKGRGQLSLFSHSFPARCSIWNPGTCVLVNWFIKMFFFAGFWNRGCTFFAPTYMGSCIIWVECVWESVYFWRWVGR